VTPERQQVVEDLFDQLADYPPDMQQELLTAACGDDLALRAEVAALLEGDARGHPILQLRTGQLASELLDGDGPTVTGRVGRYNILKYLGEGGMGSVYLASRIDVGGLVALKFLRDPWASPAGRRRFSREQSTLAGLTHRYIARLYDAGVTDGRPWFAMEYVEGVPILDHCQHNALPLHDRLRLFRAACEAVDYAHRKLVVHLDLKPSNVLVSADGEVKLLDFGIARHLVGKGSQAAATTSVHALLSLNYAAPEQILGEPIDVQADVYALGVILYQLLAGRPPVDLTHSSAVELAAALEQEPRRPSVAAREQDTVTVGASRAQWKDLDALCLKALSREKAARYASVDRLMTDIDHFLADEPLEGAMHPMRYYRFRKFLSRHRRAVGAAAAVVAFVSALVVFFNAQLIGARDRAVLSEARMERIYRLMLNLFEGDDSAAGPSEQLRVVSLLDRGAREADGLDGEPDLQAELRYVFGGLYYKLGHIDRAEALLASALAAQQSLHGSDDARTIRPQLALGLLRLDQARPEEARRLVDEALARARRQYAPGSIEVATAVAARGKVLASEGKYEDAVSLLDEAVAVLANAPPSVELSEALGDLANVHYYLGHIDVSEAVVRRGLALDRRLFGERHPSVGVGLYSLGNIALDRANYVEGANFFRQALAINEEWYGGTHPKTAATQLMLGRAAAYLGDADDAASLYERALSGMRATYGDRHVRVASVLSLMGDLARDRRDLDEAERLFERAASIFKELVGEQHEFYLHQLSNLGSVHVARQRYDEAERLLQPAVQRLTAVVPGQRYTGIAHVRLGAALAGLTDYDRAERHARTGYDILLNATSPASAELDQARRVLIDIYQRLDVPAKAAPLLHDSERHRRRDDGLRLDNVQLPEIERGVR
jgi:eukaryotic-like serine/threonine-protein kinase